MLPLRFATPSEWTETVIKNFDEFLRDHAAAEKKASGMAMSMLSHYPDRAKLVDAMIDLSIEELNHFREVVKIMTKRGLILGPDTKDNYVVQIRSHMRKGTEAYFLDRLVIAGIIEARGCERFGLVADALPEGELKQFYKAIAASELRHGSLFIDLAAHYFNANEIDIRLNELLDEEAKICAALPIVAALH